MSPEHNQEHRDRGQPLATCGTNGDTKTSISMFGHVVLIYALQSPVTKSDLSHTKLRHPCDES